MSAMDELWNEAINNTEIVRLPIKRLLTFGLTNFDYVFLGESLVNKGDTVVRKGKLSIDKPALILPGNMPTFKGFNTEDGIGLDSKLSSFFYVRGISFPSLRYTNEICEIDIFEGSLTEAERHYLDEVRNNELISTGIVIGSDMSWQFSVLLMSCHIIDNYVDRDLREIINKIKKKEGDSYEKGDF